MLTWTREKGESEPWVGRGFCVTYWIFPEGEGPLSERRLRVAVKRQEGEIEQLGQYDDLNAATACVVRHYAESGMEKLAQEELDAAESAEPQRTRGRIRLSDGMPTLTEIDVGQVVVFTGYFARHGKRPGSICIARGVPKFLPGIPLYQKLAPSYPMLRMSEREYVVAFQRILDKLDPVRVLEDLVRMASPHTPIICCYEGIDKACHRHYVAAWLRDELTIHVREMPAVNVDEEIGRHGG
jgi:hypothetical protein